MQATVIEADRYGGSDVLRTARRDVPEPGPGQALVRVRATSVNPVDWKLRAGRLRFVMRVRFPWVPGCELCGEVVRVGERVTALAPGAPVIAVLDPRAGGASAEYVVLDEGALFPRPAAMTDHEAAGLSVAGLSALQVLQRIAHVAPGQRVLVNGAAGGVGHLAVQIAKALGAEVTGVCGPGGIDMVRALGADHVIDRSREDFLRGAARYDVVFDAVAVTHVWASRRALGRGGTFVSTMPSGATLAGIALAPLFGRRARVLGLRPTGEEMAFLAGLVAEGRLRVVIDSVFPLDRLSDAHDRSQSGRAHGKIIVTC